MLTNFNYKAAYSELKLGNEGKAIQYLNKTINMLNEYGRLPNDIEAIYQKCSFKKEELLKKGNVEDKEFRKSHFLSMKTSIYILIIIIIDLSSNLNTFINLPHTTKILPIFISFYATCCNTATIFNISIWPMPNCDISVT